jgi:hypothetical protein
LLNRDVQDFLAAHLEEDLNRTILNGSPFSEVSMTELAGQIESRRKCRSKLPTWYEKPGLLYPSRISIEQASSERTARYKAGKVGGRILADLSGGLGVDSYYFSKVMKQVIWCERDPDLVEVASHNFQLLGASNIKCLNVDSLDFLEDSKEHFDWIYVDPARRNPGSERVFRLEDCSPNLLDNLELILGRADRVMLKLSPFLDIAQAIGQLKEVEEVHVVAVENEVKELIFLLREGAGDQITVMAVNLRDQDEEILTSVFRSETKAVPYGPPMKFLYEPNAAIRKAGLFNEAALRHDLTKLHPNSHLYTSDELVPFPGRRFVIGNSMNYKPKKIRRQLGLEQANITTRNFHESVAQIRKRTGIAEGGSDYLFFTTDHTGKALVLACRKVR